MPYLPTKNCAAEQSQALIWPSGQVLLPLFFAAVYLVQAARGPLNGLLF
jgi:hypothetical protein